MWIYSVFHLKRAKEVSKVCELFSGLLGFWGLMRNHLSHDQNDQNLPKDHLCQSHKSLLIILRF